MIRVCDTCGKEQSYLEDVIYPDETWIASKLGSKTTYWCSAACAPEWVKKRLEIKA